MAILTMAAMGVNCMHQDMQFLIDAGLLCFLSQADVRKSKQVGDANRTHGCQSAGVCGNVSGHLVVHGVGVRNA